MVNKPHHMLSTFNFQGNANQNQRYYYLSSIRVAGTRRQTQCKLWWGLQPFSIAVGTLK